MKIAGKTITDLVNLSIFDLKIFFDNIVLSENELAIGFRLLTEIKTRVQYLLDVGLEYLTLNRLSNTLSGGESQRIILFSLKMSWLLV